VKGKKNGAVGRFSTTSKTPFSGTAAVKQYESQEKKVMVITNAYVINPAA
jgi:hypothetical protein